MLSALDDASPFFFAFCQLAGEIASFDLLCNEDCLKMYWCFFPLTWGKMTIRNLITLGLCILTHLHFIYGLENRRPIIFLRLPVSFMYGTSQHSRSSKQEPGAYFEKKKQLRKTLNFSWHFAYWPLHHQQLNKFPPLLQWAWRMLCSCSHFFRIEGLNGDRWFLQSEFHLLVCMEGFFDYVDKLTPKAFKNPIRHGTAWCFFSMIGTFQDVLPDLPSDMFSWWAHVQLRKGWSHRRSEGLCETMIIIITELELDQLNLTKMSGAQKITKS